MNIPILNALIRFIDAGVELAGFVAILGFAALFVGGFIHIVFGR